MGYKQRRKLYSQNNLVNPKLVAKLIRLSSIDKKDAVLEIGSGKGIITSELVKTAEKVIAVELDEKLCLYLKTRFQNVNNFELHLENFLDFALPPYSYKVFSNIPFIITADVIRKLTSDKNFEEAKQTVADANRRALAVKEATTRLTERLEDVSDKEAEAHSKIVELNRREASIEAAEGELKRATESLGTKWVEYHDEVYKKNEELVRREKEILDNQKVNAIYKESLDAITREQEKLKIGIKDGYASLERAKQEILKQNGSS